MRLVENSPSRISMRDSTLWISVLCGLAALTVALAVFATHQDAKALIVAGLFALFALAFLRDSHVLFDKLTRTCTLRRRVMWRVTRSSIPFDQIDDVLIDVSMGGEPNNVITCRLSLSTRDGNVPLAGTYEPGLSRFEEMRQLLVAAIFAGRSAPPNFDVVRSLLATGRRIDAINVLRQCDGIGLAEAVAKIDAIEKGAKPAERETAGTSEMVAGDDRCAHS